MVGEVEVAVEVEAKPSSRFFWSDGLVESRYVESGVFFVWTSGKMHDFQFLGLDLEAVRFQILIEEGVGVL